MRLPVNCYVIARSVSDEAIPSWNIEIASAGFASLAMTVMHGAFSPCVVPMATGMIDSERSEESIDPSLSLP